MHQIKIVTTFKVLLPFLLLLALFTPLLASTSVSAQQCIYSGSGGTDDPFEQTDCASVVPGRSLDPGKCYEVTGFLPGSTVTEVQCDSRFSSSGDPTAGSNLGVEANCKDDGPDANNTALDKEDCAIVGYIITFTNILSGLVGVVIVIMIAVGGIQYTTARDDPQAVSAAKERIRNAVMALVFYLFAFAFLQWLIPGGLF